MLTGDDFRTIALGLDGASEKPHFDRTAFRRRITFATLAGDGGSANLVLTPEQQALLCQQHPACLAPVANKFGDRGWTRLDLSRADAELTTHLLQVAWGNAG